MPKSSFKFSIQHPGESPRIESMVETELELDFGLFESD
jgi:hypothetical protein